MLSEELRRLREKTAQWGDRPLTGTDLTRLIDDVSSDMREAHPGPEPYDLSQGSMAERMRRHQDTT